MIHDVFLEGVTAVVDEVHPDVGVVGVHLAAALVDGHEHRLDARCGLRHEACGACGRYGQACYVAPSVLGHVGVELRIGLFQAHYVGVVFLAFGVVDLECSALAGQFHRCAVGGQGERAVHEFGEVGRFRGAVAQTQRGEHVAFAGGAHSGASAHEGLAAYLLPQGKLGLLHLGCFGV